MADKVTHTEEVVLVAAFRDGDDRTISLPNPNVDVEDAADMAAYGTAINSIGTTVKTKQLLIGDKAGADFTRFKSAKVRHMTVIQLDLTA